MCCKLSSLALSQEQLSLSYNYCSVQLSFDRSAQTRLAGQACRDTQQDSSDTREGPKFPARVCSDGKAAPNPWTCGVTPQKLARFHTRVLTCPEAGACSSSITFLWADVCCSRAAPATLLGLKPAPWAGVEAGEGHTCLPINFSSLEQWGFSQHSYSVA